jgi:hypothetical protein
MNKIKEQFLSNVKSPEMLDIIQCIERAERAGLLFEVVITALNGMKEFPKSSLLLTLQVALEDWDI